MKENLETFHGKKKIEPFLDEFAAKTGLKKTELQKFVKAKNWSAFIKYCLGIK